MAEKGAIGGGFAQQRLEAVLNRFGEGFVLRAAWFDVDMVGIQPIECNLPLRLHPFQAAPDSDIALGGGGCKLVDGCFSVIGLESIFYQPYQFFEK